MKEKTIKIYKFSELSREAQMKVVENHGGDFVNNDYWYEWVYEDFKDELESKYGFIVEDMSFSGFWSQGDGASFTGEFADPIEVVDTLLNDYLYPIEQVCLKNLVDYIGITRDTNHYVHKYTVSCAFSIKDIETNKEELWDNTLEQRRSYDTLERKINEWKNEMCDKLYRELEDTYDFLTGYEHVADYYTNCDDEEQFLEDGSDA